MSLTRCLAKSRHVFLCIILPTTSSVCLRCHFSPLFPHSRLSLFSPLPVGPKSHRHRYTPLTVGLLYISALISRAVFWLLILLIPSPCIYIHTFVDFYGNFLIWFLPWMGRRTVHGDLLGSTEFLSKRRARSDLDFLYASALRRHQNSLRFCFSRILLVPHDCKVNP